MKDCNLTKLFNLIPSVIGMLRDARVFGVYTCAVLGTEYSYYFFLKKKYIDYYTNLSRLILYIYLIFYIILILYIPLHNFSLKRYLRVW
jgi:hypothetical protein